MKQITVDRGERKKVKEKWREEHLEKAWEISNSSDLLKQSLDNNLLIHHVVSTSPQ